MKLYHYIQKGNNALESGILSFANNPKANLQYYYERSHGKTTHREVADWMENCFKGRSHGIRFFTEPIKWTSHSINCLKKFVDDSDLYSVDLEKLLKDNLIEAVYVSPPISDFPNATEEQNTDEILIKLNSVDNIDFSPINWDVCDDETRRRFAYVRYYLLVIKGGVIAPEYIQKENIS